MLYFILSIIFFIALIWPIIAIIRVHLIHALCGKIMDRLYKRNDWSILREKFDINKAYSVVWIPWESYKSGFDSELLKILGL